jgi:glycosyltransferase involved in cell wall biosynthesis
VYWIEHTPASYWLKYNPLRLFYAVLARLAYIIVLYDFVKSGLEGYWVAPGSIYHIPPSIDTEAIYNRSQEKVQSVPGKFIVCSAGALHKKKGFHVVIKAIKIAREFIPNIEYVIIGDGPERENLQWLIRTLGLEQVVRIVTRRDEIYSQIASSNVYVMPDAQREAFGYEVLDAMACQRAIVAPDYGCFAELITSGQNGILVPGAQPESYAQALVTLANEPQTVTELGNQAIRHVYMHYDSEAVAQTLYNDLESAE